MKVFLCIAFVLAASTLVTESANIESLVKELKASEQQEVVAGPDAKMAKLVLQALGSASNQQEPDEAEILQYFVKKLRTEKQSAKLQGEEMEPIDAQLMAMLMDDDEEPAARFQ